MIIGGLHTNVTSVRSTPAILGYGAAMAIVLGAFNYTGGKLSGYERDPSVDEVSRKEYLRKNRRRPLEDTVTELGEGRGRSRIWKISIVQVLTLSGIYAPGYAERRAERLKEKYNFDVPAPVSAGP